MIEIEAIRNVNYIYYIIGTILFIICLLYVIKHKEDKQLHKMFILGCFMGVFFEITAILIGLREVNIKNSGYNPILSIIMGMFETGNTTTMAYIFCKKLSGENYSFSLIYLLLTGILLLLLPLFTIVFSNESTSFLTISVTWIRPVVLWGIFITIGITILCLLIMLIKIKDVKYVLYYFFYITIWGLIFVITLIITNLRTYKVYGTTNPLPYIIIMIFYTSIFEVTGLMLSAISIGVLFNILKFNNE
ncbi:MAG: hypothetical protein ACTSQJ_00955 [Promethearchaeota archaeon]